MYKKKMQRMLPVFLAIFLIWGMARVLPGATAAYVPEYKTLMVGLNAGNSAARPKTPEVALVNAGGFCFGVYDEDRRFAQTGATEADVIRITAGDGAIRVTDEKGAVLYEAENSLAVRPAAVTEAGTAYNLPEGYGTSSAYYGGFAFLNDSGAGMTVINYIDIEDYVKCVVPYEMSGSWAIEALKAQALCARTYAVYHIGKHASYGFDLCPSTECQVYSGVYTSATYKARVDAAVDATAGQYILYNGSPINAVYHAASGGATEHSENVWGSSLPYLRGVVDNYERTPELYTFSGEFTAETLYEKLLARNEDFPLSDIVDVRCTYTDMGNVLSVTFTDSAGMTKTYEKAEVRTAVLGSLTSYNSQRFTITSASQPSEADTEGEEGGGGVVFTVSSKGYGHNVGMSQFGAKGMAEAGFTCNQIIQYYYTGVSVGDEAPVEVPAEEPGEMNFADVDAAAWYYDAVSYAYGASLFAGTGDTTFSPNMAMTRGMFVTVLGRLAGVDAAEWAYTGTISGTSVRMRSGPGTSYEIVTVLSQNASVDIIGMNAGADGYNWYQVTYGTFSGYVRGDLIGIEGGAFSDVKAGAYYTAYVEWAADKGIAAGYEDGTFRPDASMTRAEMCRLMYQYTVVQGVTLEAGQLETFSDEAEIGGWALSAVKVMQGAGIISGVGSGAFAPKNTCTRAEVAQMMMGYHQRYA